MSKFPETREDWTVIYGPQDDCQFFRKALWSEVQTWISDYLPGGIEFEVRCNTVDEFCRDYTESFTPPFDEDAPSYAHASRIERAEQKYRLARERA